MAKRRYVKRRRGRNKKSRRRKSLPRYIDTRGGIRL